MVETSNNMSNMTYHTTNNMTSNYQQSFEFKAGYDSCLVILAVAIIAINLLVVYLFTKKDYLRTKTNTFLVSLAVSDLMTGLLSIPFYLLCKIIFRKQICLASAALYRCIAVSTMIHIMVVTLERYVAVMFPMRYYRMVTKRRVYFLIALVWMFSIFYAVIQFSWLNVDSYAPDKLDETLKYEKAYNFTGIVVCFAIPLLVMLFCFCQMFVVVRRQVKSIRKQAVADPRNHSIASEKRALIIFATMLGVFIVCWLSWYATLFEMWLGRYTIMPEILQDVLDFFRFGTSFFNPILYTFFKNDFRRATCSLSARCCPKLPILKLRRDSNALRMTLTTDTNGKQSTTALLNGLSPGPERSDDFVCKGSQELLKKSVDLQLISHV